MIRNCSLYCCSINDHHQREETLIYICKNAQCLFFPSPPNRKLNSKNTIEKNESKNFPLEIVKYLSGN